MATYSHTYSYNIEVPEVDTTMTTDVALTCTSLELREVNEYLERAKAVVAKRGPFSGEFKGLDSIKGRTLPFTQTKGKIEVSRHPLDATPGITSLLAGICAAVPGVGMNGKIYQVNAYFGKRVSYDITRKPHQKNIEVVQHWDDVHPGDTYVPKPKIRVVAESHTKTASRSSYGTLLSPADVIRNSRARKSSKEEDRYETPKLRLVNSSLQSEPDYLLPDNRFDPMALVWLVQTSSIDLDWHMWSDGRSWRISFNERSQKQAPIFYDNLRNVYGRAPFDVLNYLNEDTFFVPCEWMHPELVRSGMLPRGDLDLGGILILLATELWDISQNEPNAYEVHCDDRLWRGVPDLPHLIARLVWMLRAYAGYREAFSMELMPTHVASLDEKMPSFEGACYGAPENPAAINLSVMDKPIPDLNGGAQEHPFDGGFSSYRTSGYILREEQEGFEENLHDEVLFVRELQDLLLSMPLEATLKGDVFADSNGSERMRLLPGDVLTLASVWGRLGEPVSGDVVEIMAHTEEGACVGVLEEPVSMIDVGPTDFGWRELACVLPYVTCVVRSVDKSVDGVPASVELLFDAQMSSMGAIIHEAREKMREPYILRRCLSRGPLMASELQSVLGVECDSRGRFRISNLPNSVSSDFEKAKGSRPQLCENVLTFAGTESELAPLIKLMRTNVLRPIEQISGWYYSEDELNRATTVEETFQALRSDFAERLPYVFRQRPLAAYYREKHLLTMDSIGNRLVLKIWFNTYDKPNNDDLAAFFKALPATKLPVGRIYKRADKREAHVLIDTFVKGKRSFGQMRRNEKAVGLEQLVKRYEELSALGEESLGDLQLIEWAMLGEVLDNGAHKVFDIEHPVENATSPAQSQNRKSRYIAANGKVDAFAIADLIARDAVYFDKGDIVWRMGKHVIKGLHVNRAAKVDPHFASHAQDYAAGIVDLLQTLEDLDLLRVRKDDLHNSLCEKLGDTDMTGITLMQLMSWGRSLWIVGDGDSELRESLILRAGINLGTIDAQARDSVYVVVCDDRILRAVPNANLLIARLIGALRAYNGIEGPHVEVIVAVRNSEADTYLRDFKGKISRAVCDAIHIEGRLEQLMKDRV